MKHEIFQKLQVQSPLISYFKAFFFYSFQSRWSGKFWVLPEYYLNNIPEYKAV